MAKEIEPRPETTKYPFVIGEKVEPLAGVWYAIPVALAIWGMAFFVLFILLKLAGILK